MKMKNKILLSASMLLAGLLNQSDLAAQSWNVTGNAGTTPTTQFIGTTDSKDFKIRTNNSVRMTIKNNGKVGVGTGNPLAKFHVTGDGEALRVNGKNSVIQIADSSNVSIGYISNNGGNLSVGVSAANATGRLNFANAGGTILSITNTNDMYYGNASFHLTNGVNDITINGKEKFAGVFPPGNLFLQSNTPNTAGLTLGNVGIGATDVSKSKLVVEGYVGQNIAMFRRNTSSAGITITADWPEIYFNSYYISGVKAMKAGYGGLIGLDPTSGNLYFRTGSVAAANDNDPLSFTDNMVIDRLGNVGIGTFPSTYKLNVCGTIRATEVRVTTGWCDYVFADDYKLPALHDVEAFIKENKHLPDVTPGAIIENEGLEVGKTSAQMIKKIEELMLYVIDLQKQVNDLKQAVK